MFFSPPRSSKPKIGVFCFLILEAREASALEMPESHENTLVIKTESIQVGKIYLELGIQLLFYFFYYFRKCWYFSYLLPLLLFCDSKAPPYNYTFQIYSKKTGLAASGVRCANFQQRGIEVMAPNHPVFYEATGSMSLGAGRKKQGFRRQRYSRLANS